MKGNLLNIVIEGLFKKKSIPFMIVLLGAMYLGLITMFDSWENIKVGSFWYWFTGALLCIVGVVYTIACFWIDHLPRAPKNSLAVLFCIDAESKQLYEMAKFKLVDAFNMHVVEDGSNISAVCVAKQQIRKYDIHNPNDGISLLQKTNCVLITQVRYSADDITNAENYELQIHCTVSHPTFNEKLKDIISQDLRTMKGAVRRQRFSKGNAINVFSSTTQTLVCACQYILGFVYLLAGDNRNALNLLLLAKKNIAVDAQNVEQKRKLETLVDDRIFATLCQIAVDYIAVFQRKKDLQSLEESCKVLEIANRIYPETYFYNMNMAYIHIALYKNSAAAKKCLENCKKAKDNNSWVYDDAFLSAYCGHAPTTIMSKYTKAFKVPYKSLVEIVDYIEYILDTEPKKSTLHLAAGLVYEEMGEAKLKKQHLAIYLTNGIGINQKTRDLIEGKLDAGNCGENCDKNCVNCAS